VTREDKGIIRDRPKKMAAANAPTSEGCGFLSPQNQKRASFVKALSKSRQIFAVSRKE
jgi:hypothetical protein